MKYFMLLLPILALSGCTLFGGGTPKIVVDPAVQEHCKTTYKDQATCESEKDANGANVCEWFLRSDNQYVCRAKR